MSWGRAMGGSSGKCVEGSGSTSGSGGSSCVLVWAAAFRNARQPWSTPAPPCVQVRAARCSSYGLEKGQGLCRALRSWNKPASSKHPI
eukprot:876200-Pelagomonas_calceolata.AAC.2